MPKPQLNLNRTHRQLESFTELFDSGEQLQEELYQMFISSMINQTELSPEQLTSRVLLYDGLKTLFQQIKF